MMFVKQLKMSQRQVTRLCQLIRGDDRELSRQGIDKEIRRLVQQLLRHNEDKEKPIALQFRVK